MKTVKKQIKNIQKVKKEEVKQNQYYYGLLYGRGINSIAEQLHCSIEKAKGIQDKVFKGFPAIPKFEKDSKQMAREKGYVTTLWGRKRRLPNMQLDRYEFDFTEKQDKNFDPLNFDGGQNEYIDYEAIEYYTNLLNKAYGRQQKEEIKAKARKEGIIIKDNSSYIADAERQCVNSRIQRKCRRYDKKGNDINRE